MLIQVESILNSRPLSSDPTDLHPLAPGHFLVGRSLTAIPKTDVSAVSPDRLNRYQHIQQMGQHFWACWYREYLSELQRRTKWRTDKSELKINSLVLLKQDNLPPLRWKLGRIVELFPGSDGIASVRTTTGTFRRSFAHLYPLLDDA